MSPLPIRSQPRAPGGPSQDASHSSQHQANPPNTEAPRDPSYPDEAPSGREEQKAKFTRPNPANSHSKWAPRGTSYRGRFHPPHGHGGGSRGRGYPRHTEHYRGNAATHNPRHHHHHTHGHDGPRHTDHLTNHYMAGPATHHPNAYAPLDQGTSYHHPSQPFTQHRPYPAPAPFPSGNQWHRHPTPYVARPPTANYHTNPTGPKDATNRTSQWSRPSGSNQQPPPPSPGAPSNAPDSKNKPYKSRFQKRKEKKRAEAEQPEWSPKGTPTPVVQEIQSNRENCLPILVVLDLNGTLLRRGINKSAKLRPFLPEFRDYLLRNFNAMVWSSATPVNVQRMVDQVFDSYQHLLRGVWARNRCVVSRTEFVRANKPVTYKPLNFIWKAHQIPPHDSSKKVQLDRRPWLYRTHSKAKQSVKWSAQNTIIVDDSALKAQAHLGNHIEVNDFDANPSMRDYDLQALVAYLREFREIWTNMDPGVRTVPRILKDFPWIQFRDKFVPDRSRGATADMDNIDLPEPLSDTADVVVTDDEVDGADLNDDKDALALSSEGEENEKDEDGEGNEDEYENEIPSDDDDENKGSMDVTK
ncbi:hypothetical protein BJ085DRAFT_28778 [Dimargaris cristalligena]|uniref:Mitochondrial import inner membrane translocase subunit TIM50 n=1 Tax=Dimargaris cristalligena TaxID=215637 RepID=A0A4P9ZZB9_9FUNG|nr:hypothetical protein BJ085DRAFT_28778 [Dimargaris cristalligena]|eukprot:RKP39047.1 hypothetical protein BJ085DRAFT_28778 [Dimargaris cristalligena]